MSVTRTRLLAVVLVALLVVPGVAAASVRGSPDLRVAVADNRLAVGESGTLELTVANSGDLDLASVSNPALNDRVTTARGVEVTLGAGDAPLTVESDANLVGGIASGGSVAVDFGVTVDEDATPGRYTLPVDVEYSYTSSIAEVTGAITERTVRERSTVTVVVEDGASFRVVDASADVRVGERGSVSATLLNTGTASAEDATVSIASADGAVAFAGTETATRYVGPWAPGEMRTVTYDATVVGNGTPRAYAARVVVSYVDADGDARTSRPFAVGIEPQRETALTVSNVDASLYVGEEGTLAGTIVNEGPGTAFDGVVSLRTDTAGIESIDGSVAVGTLDPGASAAFEFSPVVSTDATPGVRPFSVVLTYEAEDGETRTSDPVRVDARVRPDREFFAVESVNATFAPDTSNRLELLVTNVGETAQRNVVVEATPTRPFESVGPVAYVPELAPGESTTVALELTVDEDAVPSSHALDLNVTSEPADGPDEATDSYRVRVDVAEETRSVDPAAVAAVALLGVAVLVAVGYWWFRRR